MRQSLHQIIFIRLWEIRSVQNTIFELRDALMLKK